METSSVTDTSKTQTVHVAATLCVNYAAYLLLLLLQQC